MKTGIIALSVVLWLAPAAARADQEMLASAKALYESASYEAALSELSRIDSKEHVDVVDTYRALCLLGLGRTRDAEDALQLIATRTPLLMLSEAEYSPRLVALYREVRKSALPVAAQQLYSTAKSDFESKNYESAAVRFRQTLQVVEEVDPNPTTGTLADLKQLAEGFLTLAEGRIVQKPAPPPVPQPPAITITKAAAAPTVYTLLDTDVTPPTVTAQRLPAWRFQPTLLDRAFRGQLELLIDETGAVQNAAMVKSIWPAYDAELVEAARKWRYRPAVKDGKPVKFRRVLDINIDPSLRPTR